MTEYLFWLAVLAGVALSLTQPFFLLMIVVALIPLEWFTTAGGATLNRFLIPCVAIGWVIERQRTGRALRLKRANATMSAWLAWGFVSILWSTGRRWSSAILSLAMALILFIVISQLVDTRKRFQWMIKAFMLGVLVFIVLYFATGVTVMNRYFTPGIGSADISEYGNMVGVAFICDLLLVLFGRGMVRLAAAVGLLPIGYLVIAAGLRRSFVGVAFSALAVGLSSKGRALRLVFVATGLSLAVTWVWDDLMDFFPSWVRQRYDVEYTMETSAAGRFNIWGVALDTWRESPLIGVGLGEFGRYSLQRPETGYMARSVHNVPLQVLTELGAIGLLLWGGSWIRAWQSAFRAHQIALRERRGAVSAIPLGLMVFLFVIGLTNPLLEWRVLWFSWGMAVAGEEVFCRGQPDRTIRSAVRTRCPRNRQALLMKQPSHAAWSPLVGERRKTCHPG